MSLSKTIQALKNGQTLLYPTDTIWGLGCDATNAQAVAKIYQLKQRLDSKALIVLVKDLEMLEKYVVDIPTTVFAFLAKKMKPLTIIYPTAQHLASNLIASDGSIAIRIPEHDFCQALLTAFDKPIVSTSANISGEPSPTSDFETVSQAIKDKVDCIAKVDNPVKSVQPSTILKINLDGSVEVIRP